MATTTISPPVGRLYVATSNRSPLVAIPSVTYAPAASTERLGFKLSNAGLTGYTLSKVLDVRHLALNVKTGLGYLPPGITVIGFAVKATDMDTGTPAIAQSLFLNTTEVVTSITVAQGGTSSFYVIAPTAITSMTPVYVKTTTVPATAASGTIYVTPFYYST